MSHQAECFSQEQLDAFKELLSRYGLEVRKTANTQGNVGVIAEVALLIAINSPSGWMIVNSHTIKDK